MSLTVANWTKLITDEKGRMQVMGVVEALQDVTAFPLFAILPFVPKMGSSYLARLAASSTQKATRPLNSAFTESAPGVGELNFPMRAAGGDLNIDINMTAADNTGLVRASLLTQKIIDIGARLNRMFFKGDKDAVAADEFEGVDNLCADLSQVITAGANGATLTSTMLDDLLARVPGANVILCNRTLAIQADALGAGGITRTVVVTEDSGLKPGMYRKQYKGVPIIEVLTAPDDTTATHAEILAFDETQGGSNVCSRITAARVGLTGVYGIHNSMMQLFPPVRDGGFEKNHLNWFMAPLATDRKDSIAQIKGLKAA